jgi:hypothetical protein
MVSSVRFPDTLKVYRKWHIVFQCKGPRAGILQQGVLLHSWEFNSCRVNVLKNFLLLFQEVKPQERKHSPRGRRLFFPWFTRWKKWEKSLENLGKFGKIWENLGKWEKIGKNGKNGKKWEKLEKLENFLFCW